VIYTVESEHGTHLAIEHRTGKRGPSKIELFPRSSLTDSQCKDLTRKVRAAARQINAKHL
jgi:predicted DNA-binding WGR domain protein